MDFRSFLSPRWIGGKPRLDYYLNEFVLLMSHVAVSGKRNILECMDHLHDAFEAPASITSGGMHTYHADSTGVLE